MFSHTKIGATKKRGAMRVRTLDESLRGSRNSNRLSNSQQSNVSFHKLYVREYGMVLGDNPCVRSGPPVSIGWEVQDEYHDDLENHERSRGPRRETREMVISRPNREALLRAAGHSKSEFASVIRQTNRIKNQRMSSARNVSSTKFEEKIEKVINRIKRLFMKKKIISYEHTWDPNRTEVFDNICCKNSSEGQTCCNSALNMKCVTSEIDEGPEGRVKSSSSTSKIVADSDKALNVKKLSQITIEEDP